MKRFYFALIAISLCAISLQAQHRYHPTPGMIAEMDADSAHSWNALHYDLDLMVTPSAPPGPVYLNGKAHVTLTPTITTLETIDLHLVGLEVDSISLSGTACSWTRQDCLLFVELPSQYNPVDTLDLMIAYQGEPLHTGSLLGGVGIFNTGSNGGTVYSQVDPRGLRNWMPCWDEPWDKATIRQKLSFPNAYTGVVANGTRESVVPGAQYTQWTYFMDRPIATYLVTFAASAYASFTQTLPGVSIRHYVYPSSLQAAQNDFQRVSEMIQSFGQFFGAYPFASFGYAQTPVFGSSGAMENQTMVLMGQSLITGNGASEDIFAHELAHQWFGDAVGYLDWPEMWLSEGFATYAEALWHQHLDGMNAYHATANQFQNTYKGWENPANPHPMYDPPWDIIWTPLTYEKGACVLHMLRYQVDDSASFFQILQDYFSQYEYGHASTQDLKNTAETVTGDDYDWFFNQWVYQPGFPQFEYFGVPSPGGLTLTVAQTQSANYPRFRTEADLYCYVGSLPAIRRITIEALPTQEIQVLLPATPDSIRLDPVNWILCSKERRDDLTGPILSDTNAAIADADSSGFLDPGESGGLSFTLLNSGLPTGALTLYLSSLDPQLTIMDSVRTTPALPYYGQYNLSGDPFPVTNTGFDSRWVQFRLRINQGTVPLDTLLFWLPAGTPHLLLVDDDGGGSAQAKHQQALFAIGQVYRTETYVHADSLPPFDDYQAVIWSCGQQTANTITSADQMLLQSYLMGGGCLFLSGRGVVPELSGTTFFTNILHAGAPGGTGSPLLEGADSLVLGLHFFAFGDNGLDVTEPDGLPGSVRLLAFQGTTTGAAVKYEGAWKSCVLGFGFEDLAVGNPNFDDPYELLGPVLTWFGVDPSPVVPGLSPNIASQFQLYQNHPNPFNGSTVIRYKMQDARYVSLKLYDTSGRLVATLVNGWRSAGNHEAVFDGSGLASGIYIVKMIMGDYNAAIKIVLLK